MPRYVNCIHGDSQSRFLFAKVHFLRSYILYIYIYSRLYIYISIVDFNQFTIARFQFLINPRRQGRVETWENELGKTL